MTSGEQWQARSTARTDALVRSANDDVALAAGRIVLATTILIVLDVLGTLAGVGAGVAVMLTTGDVLCIGSLCAQTTSSHPFLLVGLLLILASLIGGAIVLIFALWARLSARHRLYTATNGRRSARGRH